jgi:AMP nucleosidase
MISSGVKTEYSDKHVTQNFAEEHIKIGIASLNQLINNGLTVKHLKF